VQALDNEDIGIAHRIERTRLVLAVLELALLVSRERQSQPIGDGVSELGRGIDGKKP